MLFVCPGRGVAVVDSECGLDNRGIVDDGSAQALKESAILKLRAEARGKVGFTLCLPRGIRRYVLLTQEVVGTVVQHSTSFKIKTKYSQEKYIDKKKRK